MKAPCVLPTTKVRNMSNKALKRSTGFVKTLVALLACSIALYLVVRVQYRELPTFIARNSLAVRGAFHVHSASSHDSTLSLEAIAKAAIEARLDFVVLADHDTQLAGPVEQDGIWFLSYAELSTPYGHIIQLGGEGVVARNDRTSLQIFDHIKEIGALPVLAHPSDRKRPWDGPLNGMGGIEIASFSTAARQLAGPLFVGLLPAFLAYPLQPELALVQLYRRDDRALVKWDSESSAEIPGFCSVDAHGHVDLAVNLRAWITTLQHPVDLSNGNAPHAILSQLRSGSFSCLSGLMGSPPSIVFEAHTRTGVLGPGREGIASEVYRLRASVPPLQNTPGICVLLRNGEEVMRSDATALVYDAPMPGTYRVEWRAEIPNVFFGNHVAPIAYSNRIRIAPNPPPVLEEE